MIKDADPALKLLMQPAEIERVKFISSLPAGTELRAANATIGEVGSGVLSMKGVPIQVSRNSTAYRNVLAKLEAKNVGGSRGFADRSLIADAFFANRSAGVIPRFVTADKNVVKRLAEMATPPIDVVKTGGFDGIVTKYGTSGFTVTIDGFAITVIPVP